jgi:hypothetical protein
MGRPQAEVVPSGELSNLSRPLVFPRLANLQRRGNPVSYQAIRSRLPELTEIFQKLIFAQR